MVQLWFPWISQVVIPKKKEDEKAKVLSWIWGIAWVGTWAWVWVKQAIDTTKKLSENIVKVPAVQKQIAGRINQKKADMENSVLASIDVLQWQKTQDELVNEYSQKMSTWAFNNAMDLVSDIARWRDLDDLHNEYSDIDRDVVNDIYKSYVSIKNPEKDPSIVRNYVSWLLWQLPQELANTAKFALKSVMDWNITNKIADLVSWWELSKNITNPVVKKITQLWDEAQMEIDDYIGWDMSSKSYKIWKLTTEILPALLTRKPSEKMALEWATMLEWVVSKFPKLLEFIRNPRVNKLIQNSISSIPQTQAMSIGKTAETASPSELVAWAIWNTILPNKIAKEKQWVLDLITESTTAKWMKAAFEQNLVKPLPKWLDKFWNGVHDMLKPSQKTYDAVNTIVGWIKNFSKEPQVLYNQIWSKIEQIAKPLSGKLKNIVWYDAGLYDNMLLKLKDAEWYLWDTYWNTLKNKVSLLVDKASKITNMDDVWNIKKEFNAFIPDNIKKWVWLDGKDSIIHDVWNKTQIALNEYMEKSAQEAGEQWVATAFKEMSNLLHAKWKIVENSFKLIKESRWLKQKLWELWENWLKIYLLWKMLWWQDTHWQVNSWQ